jgi:superfamily II DNA or RNA helicase
MTETLRIHKLNDVHLKVVCDAGILYELGEYFTFNVPGARFSPAFKNRVWDGKIRLFHSMRGTLYTGLLNELLSFAKDRKYNVEYDNLDDFAEDEFPDQKANEFIFTLELPHTVRDYQYEAFVHCVRRNRALLLSPTASGKSLIIFMLAAYYVNEKVLIVTPNVSLVHQMAADFISYGCPEHLIHKIHEGQPKDNPDAYFTITTWQSIYKQPKKWFDKYGAVIGDEAHQFKAKSLVSIMEQLVHCRYRFGFTGTLDGTNTNKLVLEGLFGPVRQVTTTSEMMQKKNVAQLQIKALVLNYSEATRKLFAKSRPDYKSELKYIVRSTPRNKFLINLASSLKNNTLLLFNFVEHGKLLYNAIKQQNPNRSVFMVYGKVEGEEREDIRKYTEENTDVIIVASYKTFSTGINIPSLENVIFGSPSKSRVRVLQSIGRALRVSDKKESAKLYDVADDISWQSYKNTSIRHFSERVQMYNQEQFDYKIYTINVKDNS